MDYYVQKDSESQPEPTTCIRPVNVRGQRILKNGTLETTKRERVRTRIELTEYNRAARVLRKQAKQTAVEAGLRKHAELTGKLSLTNFTVGKHASLNGYYKCFQRIVPQCYSYGGRPSIEKTERAC